MPKRTDAEIGRLVRKAMNGARIKPRRLFLGLQGIDPDDPYLESDRDFLTNNSRVASAILEALAPPKRKKKNAKT